MISNMNFMRNPRSLGTQLATARRYRRWKQSYVAEMLGVSQSTVCRIENGEIELSARLRESVVDLLSAQLRPSGDAAIKRLVEGAQGQVHLICDVSHRLLAASDERERAWGATVTDIGGKPLWHYATSEIEHAEAQLSVIGWGEPSGAWSISFVTSENHSPELKISKGTITWERIILSDGSPARLTTRTL